MPRFYVKNKEDKWNIYSTIVDDLLFDDFMEFKDLKEYVCRCSYEDKAKEMDTLLTDKKELNYMEYEEMLDELKIYNKAKYDKLNESEVK